MTDSTTAQTDLAAEARRQLSEAEAELEDADARAAAARENVEKYQKFLEVLGELTGGNDAHAPTPPRSASGRRLDGFGIKLAEGAQMVLEQSGKPLKNRQIADRMLTGGFRYDNEARKLRMSIGATLDRKATKEGVIFKKVAPGIFGLLAWDQE